MNAHDDEIFNYLKLLKSVVAWENLIKIELLMFSSLRNLQTLEVHW